MRPLEVRRRRGQVIVGRRELPAVAPVRDRAVRGQALDVLGLQVRVADRRLERFGEPAVELRRDAVVVILRLVRHVDDAFRQRRDNALAVGLDSPVREDGIRVQHAAMAVAIGLAADHPRAPDVAVADQHAVDRFPVHALHGQDRVVRKLAIEPERHAQILRVLEVRVRGVDSGGPCLPRGGRRLPRAGLGKL